jgi:truncated hemoglobin YjbI
MTESSLYERLGGAFAIAAVVDHFSEAVVQNPINETRQYFARLGRSPS